jgi:hypothetical protein
MYAIVHVIAYRVIMYEMLRAIMCFLMYRSSCLVGFLVDVTFAVCDFGTEQSDFCARVSCRCGA